MGQGPNWGGGGVCSKLVSLPLKKISLYMPMAVSQECGSQIDNSLHNGQLLWPLSYRGTNSE